MIHISNASLTSLQVELGKADKPSVHLDLHVAENIAMGAKMHFPGSWLDQQRASLGPLQQKMFDVALKVLSGDEKPRAVQANGMGREIFLDRPAYGATTISIGFEKPMSEVLGFLGMSDGKDKALLSLGTKLANTLSPSTKQAGNDSLMAKARSALPGNIGLGSVIRNITGGFVSAINNPAAQLSGNGEAPPPLPPRPGRQNGNPNSTYGSPPLPQRPRANSFPRTAREAQAGFSTEFKPSTGRTPKETPPPLPPRPGQGPKINPEQASGEAPFFGHASASSFSHADYENYEMDPNEAQAAENKASQEPPKPHLKSHLSQVALHAKLNGQRPPDEGANAKSPRPEKNSTRAEPNGPEFNGERPSAGKSRASSAPPPRQTREPGIDNDKPSTHSQEDETTTNGAANVAEDIKAKPAVKSLYARLGLFTASPTEREIRKAYRRLALEKHPDHNKSPEATAEFRELQEAYEILQDPEKRRAYDLDPDQS
ncbi:DnaJ domain-containing protein [Pseudomonas sp. JZ134]|uniref:J domain-containing protein n=1 Tax=Pseudomonas sp. JZ134 TaxID=2806615 RepID=UPI003DA080D0